MIERIRRSLHRGRGYEDITAQNNLSQERLLLSGTRLIDRVQEHVTHVLQEPEMFLKPQTLLEDQESPFILSLDLHNFDFNIDHPEYFWRFAFQHQTRDSTLGKRDEASLRILREDKTNDAHRGGYESIDLIVDKGAHVMRKQGKAFTSIRYTDINRSQTDPGDYQARDNEFAIEMAHEVFDSYLQAFEDYTGISPYND